MRVRAFLAAVVLAATVAACGGSSATPSPSAATSEAPASAAAEQPSASTPAAEATPSAGESAATGGTVYTVKKNDTLWAIAQKFHTTVKAIQDANPDVKDPTKLRIGQKLTIP